jgi:hypothetical protein
MLIHSRQLTKEDVLILVGKLLLYLYIMMHFNC